jgi:hypothetical protein
MPTEIEETEQARLMCVRVSLYVYMYAVYCMVVQHTFRGIEKTAEVCLCVCVMLRHVYAQYVCSCIHVPACLPACVCVCARVCVYIYIYMHTHTHIYIYIYTQHIYIHTHIYIYTQHMSDKECIQT